MTKFKYSIIIAIVIYFLVTKSVDAAYCSTIPNSGNYTVGAQDTGCYIVAAGETGGLDNSGGSASSTTNSAVLSIAASTSLTIPSGNPTTTTLAVGTISLGAGASIVIGSNAQIKINTPLWVVDADGDGAPSSLTAAIVKPTSGVRRSYATKPTTIDCDDAQANVYYSHSACYWDLDGDTYTSNNTNGKTCLNNSSCNSATYGSVGGGVAPTAYTAGRLQNSASATADCDDNNAAIFGATMGYVDADNDSYGASGSALVNTGSCGAIPAGYADRLGDCADNNANVHWNSLTCSGTAFTNYLSASSYDYDCNGTEAKCGTTYDISCSYTTAQDKACIGSGSTGCSTNQYASVYGTAGSFACGATGCKASTTRNRKTTCTTRAASSGGCILGGNVAYTDTVSTGPQTCN